MDRDDIIFFGSMIIMFVVIALAVLYGLATQQTYFERLDKRVQECMLTERYSREECILLLGRDE